MSRHPYARCLSALRAIQADQPLPGRPGTAAPLIAQAGLALIMVGLLAAAVLGL